MPLLFNCCACFAVLLAAGNIANAHDFWVDVADYEPETGHPVAVSIRGGHHFPRSEIVLKKALIKSVELRAPNGSTTPIELGEGAQCHTGTVTCAAAGVYRIDLAIQRPGMRKPHALARALFRAGAGGDAAETCASGSGYEIVPGSPPDADAGELPLALHADGIPHAAAFTVYPEDGRTLWLKSTAESPALLRVQPATKYLVTANVDGVAVTLTFQAGTP